MRRPTPPRKAKSQKPKAAPSRFAPSAFLRGSPETVQKLCEELAAQASRRFVDLTGTTWKAVGTSIAQQLRVIGHDLSNFDDSEEAQEWQATWHHPKATYSLFLVFRPTGKVEVTFRADDATYVARA